MKFTIVVPEDMERTLRAHLFQNELEQGAFLFARVMDGRKELCLEASDIYLVPPEGWQIQLDVYLEMKDTERAKIMNIARSKNLAVIDCHSHPDSGAEVWFSSSDHAGITEFATYAKWKLDGKPYAAMVWGEASVDAVVWHGTFIKAQRIDELRIVGHSTKVLIPRGTWSRTPKPLWQRKRYGS